MSLFVAPLQDIVTETTLAELLLLMQQIQDVLRYWQEVALRNIPRVLIAAVVLLLAFLLDDRAQRAVERVVGLRGQQRELARLLGRMARGAVLIFALLTIVAVFQLTAVVTTFVASLGIAGLVVAFALQDITKNFAAGVLLLILRPFRLDDRIKVKEFEGVVTDISLRATELRTSDGEQVLVPNADVYGSSIINFSRYPQRRHHVTLELPATVPFEPVRQRLEAALRELPAIAQEPAPEVVITGTAGGILTLDARYWLPSTAPDAAQTVTQVAARLQRLIEAIKAQAAQPTAAPSDAR